MANLFYIAIGGALGAVLRYATSNAVYMYTGKDFPYGTMLVNIVGSFVMGLLFIVLNEKISYAAEWRAFLTVGLLGAFTTFSTFSIETLVLLQQGEIYKAGLNILLSVLICLIAAWIGLLLGRAI